MPAALLGGTPLTAGELANRAGISPQTASTHLAKLVRGGLLSVTISGRNRSYQLTNAEVAHTLGTLATLAPPAVTRSLHEGMRDGRSVLLEPAMIISQECWACP
jgi:predicted ArsR family transcriptional regulator